jgi:hypothetical protein
MSRMTTTRQAGRQRQVGRQPRRRGPRPGVYFAIAAALIVLLAAVVVGVVVTKGGARPETGASVGRPADSGIAPSAYTDAPSTRAFARIDRRKADAKPLTRSEVFSKSARTVPDGDAHARLALTGSRLDTDCAAAIWGAGLGDELRRGGCTQVVRGAYTAKKAGYAAMVAIFNLADAENADRVVESLGTSAGAGFVIPLPAAEGFGEGFSIARGRAMGHYVVISWVRRLDGRGDEQNAALLSLLVTMEGPKAILNRAAASG